MPDAPLTMNIAFCINDAYADKAGVVLTSVLVHHPDIPIVVWILSSDLSEESLAKLRKLRTLNDRLEIRRVSVPLDRVARCESNNPYISKDSFFRFLLPDILPTEDRVLYLDADLCVRGSLRMFYESNLSGLYMAGAEDTWCRRHQWHARFGLDVCVNSGVLLMNLDAMRKDGLSERLLRTCELRQREFLLIDQDAINIACAGRLLIVDGRYNFTSQDFRRKSRKARNEAVVWHYTGGHKPWKKRKLFDFRFRPWDRCEALYRKTVGARRLCFIARNHKFMRSGNRARADNEQVLTHMGAVSLGWPTTFFRHPVPDAILTFTGLCKGLLSLRKGDVLVVHYPLHHYYECICAIARWKRADVITCVLDLGCFRRKKISRERESELLSASSALIVHGENMRRLLTDEFKLSVPMTTLGPWDFITPGTETPPRRPHADSVPSLVFAGVASPARNGFLYELAARLEKTRLHVYGEPVDMQIAPPAFIPHGNRAAEEIIRSGEGAYGLVWYGSSCRKQEGLIGDYLRYIMSNKLSLYCRCGIPTIVWSESGMADFITREKCGLLVDTLEDLEARLLAVTPEEYEEMAANARRIGAKLAAGEYFRDAVRRAVALLRE